MHWNPKSVLITGITGFVGSHMADLISSKYPTCKIYASKRWHLSNLSNVHHILPKINFIDCDLTDHLSTSEMVREAMPEYIFHFAAESFVSASWKNPSRYMNLNYYGTVNLLEALRHYSPETIIHIPGSGEEYGDISQSQLPITEETNINPVNPYAVTKVAQDLIAKVYYDSYGLSIVRTRSFNHEGPRRKIVFGLPWYAYQIARIAAGYQEPLIYTGIRSDKRNFTHVIDMCEAYLLAVQHCIPGELYLVGNSSHAYEITFDEALEWMIKKSGLSNLHIKERSEYIRPTQVPYLIADCSKFVSATSWRPIKTLDDILSDTLNYWMEHQELRYSVNTVGNITPR